ncbi:MAG: hypothetical protein ACR2KV_05620 [Solirubrobacteraceae bacterium]
MSDAARRILEPELGKAIPDGLDELTEEELNGFAEILRVAKRRQSQQLEGAVEEALDIVPRLLRGTVRKMLFG